MILTHDSFPFPLTITSVIILTGRILYWLLHWWWPLEWELLQRVEHSSSWKNSLKQKVVLNSNAEKQVGSTLVVGGRGKLGSNSGMLPKQFVLVPQIIEIADLIN